MASAPLHRNYDLLRVCLWVEELQKLNISEQCAKIMDFTCRRPFITPFYFSESTVKTPLVLVLLLLVLSLTIHRSFAGETNYEHNEGDSAQARKFLVLHKASRECLDNQAVETVCHTLEDMVMDSMKGLSCKEIWAYEVVHLQKLRELGYKLVEFLDDLKRDTRDSHNLAPTQVLTNVAMMLVLEREVRCLTNRDKAVPVHSFSALSQSAADQVDNKAIDGMHDLLEHTRMAA